MPAKGKNPPLKHTWQNQAETAWPKTKMSGKGHAEKEWKKFARNKARSSPRSASPRRKKDPSAAPVAGEAAVAAVGADSGADGGTAQTSSQPEAPQAAAHSELRRKPLHIPRWLNAKKVVAERALVVREGYLLESPQTSQISAGTQCYLIEARRLNGDVRGLIAETPLAGVPALG